MLRLSEGIYSASVIVRGSYDPIYNLVFVDKKIYSLLSKEQFCCSITNRNSMFDVVNGVDILSNAPHRSFPNEEFKILCSASIAAKIKLSV